MPTRLVFPDKLLARVRDLAAAADSAGEVMPALEKLMWRDNERGLLAGTDKGGAPLAPLRPRTIKYRRSAMGQADPHAPPLIPCRKRSRAIDRYRVTHLRKGKGTWVLLGAWLNVLSARGTPFLGFHAEGAGHLPIRDIFGVRPKGREEISAALREWLLSKWGKP